MKKILFYALLGSLFFMQGCSSDDGFWEDEIAAKSNFPKQSEELGKAVAKELRETVKNLNAMGVDYSNADNSAESRTLFYEDLYKASPSLKKSKSSFNQLQMSPEEFSVMWNNLTNIQIEFVERIISEYGESPSEQAYLQKLIDINNDIYSSVPKIEQERLLNLTATLYYGLNEIHNLERQGQMLQTSYNGLQSPRLRSGSESGGGSGGSCRVENASAWSYVVGAILWTGEVVISATVIAGSALLAFTMCFTGDKSGWEYECDAYASRCAGKQWDGNRRMDCSECYRYCISNRGQWNWSSCPL